MFPRSKAPQNSVPSIKLRRVIIIVSTPRWEDAITARPMSMLPRHNSHHLPHKATSIPWAPVGPRLVYKVVAKRRISATRRTCLGRARPRPTAASEQPQQGSSSEQPQQGWPSSALLTLPYSTTCASGTLGKYSRSLMYEIHSRPAPGLFFYHFGAES